MNKRLSLLGLCRKAGKLSLGHDAVIDSVRKSNASLVILTADASPRHEREVGFINNAVKIIRLRESASDSAPYIGKKCCILSVNDSGFANALLKLTDEEEPLYDIEIQNS